MGFSARPSRRTVLAGAIAVAGGVPLAGCTPAPAPAPPDPFQPLVEAATAHAELADAIAAAHPPLAVAAQLVAADRRVHADTMAAEVRRATPSPAPPPPSPASTGSTATSTPSPVPPDPATARTALRDASVTAQRQAADLVGSLPRHRAGLAASVAACCASHVVVLG